MVACLFVCVVACFGWCVVKVYGYRGFVMYFVICCECLLLVWLVLHWFPVSRALFVGFCLYSWIVSVYELVMDTLVRLDFFLVSGGFCFL